MDKRIYKIVNFLVMSDGGVYFSGKNASFTMNMLAEHRDFLEWCKRSLEHFTSCTLTPRKLQEDGYKRKPQLRLQSKAHPYFTKLRNTLYIDGYKGLNSHYLKLLDAEALAILYMCDGCLGMEKPNAHKGLINPSYNISLNLKRLSEGDTLMLKKSLKNNLQLEFNICRSNSYYWLRLRSKDRERFMTLITPYIQPSFQYKLISV